MAADTVREECDERTGEYRENEAGEDRDPLHSVSSRFIRRFFLEIRARKVRIPSSRLCLVRSITS